MRNYFIVYENGSKQLLQTENPLKLKTLQVIVGGYIEVVYDNTDKKICYIVDEEGILKNKKQNPFHKEFVGTVVMTNKSNLYQ